MIAKPKGKNWHNIEFYHYPEWTPEGYRPLLMLEPCEEGDEVLWQGKWTTRGIDKGAEMTALHLPTRTKRPLP